MFTRKFLFVLLIVSLLTTLSVGSALAAPPEGKRQPAGWYWHDTGNGTCKDKYWSPYGPPYKNKEWHKGKCPKQGDDTPPDGTTPPDGQINPTDLSDITKLVWVTPQIQLSAGATLVFAYGGDALGGTIRAEKVNAAGEVIETAWLSVPWISSGYITFKGKLYRTFKIRVGVDTLSVTVNGERWRFYLIGSPSDAIVLKNVEASWRKP